MTMTSRPYRCWRPTLRPGVVLCVILIFVSCQMYIMQSSLIRKDIVKPKEKNKMSNPEVTRDVNKRLLLQPGPIFYNLFVPPNNVKNTQRIVKEQIQERNWTSPNATILYTLIGDASFQNYVTSLCQHSDDEMSSSSSSSCILREHIPSYGDEQHTLQSLWEYCQQQTRTFDNQDIFVTYIHDKGSFHATEANEKARRMATKGALDCRNVWPQAKHPRSCNICMGAFHIFPQYLASANMWTAQCSYIRQLISPNEYPTQMQAMFDETLNHSTLQYSSDYACLRPYHDAPNFWGLGRYALERWALSHPHVKPCDVLPIGEGQVSWDEFPQLWKPKLRRAPRDNAKALGIQTGPYKSTWARLNGRLFEWQWMYHATPPNTSWVWKWYKGFEDGASGFQNMCQSKIRQYNNSTQLTNAP